MMKKLSLVSLLSVALFTACQSSTVVKPKESVVQKESTMITIPADSKQLIKVITPNWSAKEGILQRYERTKNGWQKVGKEINIILGRNGLAWGLGLHTIPKNAQYIKQEGDGKAPAGLFSLGHGFGYHSLDIEFPYKVYKQTDHCVDDSNSKWYNRIVDSTQTDRDYKSFERMRLKSDEYKYGITVNHNPNQVALGGSCIFIHIRNNKKSGTAGCTAMSEDEIVEILEWLDSVKKPLLLQLPKSELHYLSESSLRQPLS